GGGWTAALRCPAFGPLPLLGVVATALAEPAMPVLLGLAFATAGLGLVAPGGAAVLAWANGWTAAYIALCASAIGSMPFAEIQTWRGLAAFLAAGIACARGAARPAGERALARPREPPPARLASPHRPTPCRT